MAAAASSDIQSDQDDDAECLLAGIKTNVAKTYEIITNEFNKRLRAKMTEDIKESEQEQELDKRLEARKRHALNERNSRERKQRAHDIALEAERAARIAADERTSAAESERAKLMSDLELERKTSDAAFAQSQVDRAELLKERAARIAAEEEVTRLLTEDEGPDDVAGGPGYAGEVLDGDAAVNGNAAGDTNMAEAAAHS